MSDTECTAADRRSEPIAKNRPGESPRRALMLRSENLSSRRLPMYVEDEECEEHLGHSSSLPRNGINRLVDLNLLLMILIIGVPLLTYCIMSSP